MLSQTTKHPDFRGFYDSVSYWLSPADYNCFNRVQFSAEPLDYKTFLSYYSLIASVMELVYIRHLKCRARMGLGVRLSSEA